MVNAILWEEPFKQLSPLEKYTLLVELAQEFNNAKLGMEVGIALEKIQEGTTEYLHGLYWEQKKAAQIKDQVEKKPTIQTVYVPDNPVDIVVTRDAEQLSPAAQRRSAAIDQSVAAAAGSSAAPARNYSFYYILAGLLFFSAIACGYALKLKAQD